jgi:hypothetical protein
VLREILYQKQRFFVWIPEFLCSPVQPLPTSTFCCLVTWAMLTQYEALWGIQLLLFLTLGTRRSTKGY